MLVLLADIGGIFAIAFLLISFIGWIINLINTQNPPPAPNRGPQRRPRARDGKVQNEIEQFLQEAMGNKDPRARREDVADDEIEILEPGPKRRPPRERPKKVRTQVARESKGSTEPSARPRRRKPGSGVTGRHMSPSPLGQSVTSHVKEHMRERVSQESQTHLPHNVDKTVGLHLGEFTADDHDPRSTVVTRFRSRANVADPTGLINELRTQEGMRKAILLQEILAKPRGLRK